MPADPPSAAPTPRRLSFGKRWLFRGLALLIALAVIESISAIVWWLQLPGSSLEGSREYQADVAQGINYRTHPTESLHPYLGWVLNPDLHPRQQAGGRTWSINRYGFVDDGDTVYHRSPDQLIVGIVGGSVAQQMSLIAGEALRKKLESAPELRARKVRFVRLALSGHKQPQQLMALSYLLAIGGELDVLINVDGYNEAALPLSENAPAGVSLAWPRAWHARLMDVVDPRIDSESYELLRLRVVRRRLARLLMNSWLRYSPTAMLIGELRSRRLYLQMQQLGETVRDHKKSHGHSFAQDGPSDDATTYEGRTAEAAQLWANSSRQLAHLCAGSGIAYVHVLQPNQYLEGSKPLSETELNLFYDPQSNGARAVRAVYPQMQTLGRQLQSEGVRFHDHTALFSNEHDTIYVDYFCHYNDRGNEMLAEAAAEDVLAALKDQTLSTSSR